MRIELPTGGVAHLYISHSEWRKMIVPEAGIPVNRRMTKIQVEMPNGNTLNAESICSEKDQFRRKVGRILAGKKIVRLMQKEKFPKEDMRAICRRIFE